MRRRMQHLGTGPYSENQRATPQEQRKKRIERRKQRLEEERERLRRSSPTGKITLGRKNLYFIIAVAALIILLIVIFVILRMPMLSPKGKTVGASACLRPVRPLCPAYCQVFRRRA